jgi:hypothetical protein
MSTKSTLAYYDASPGQPSWHFYEEVLESDVVYLQLEGVVAELSTLEPGGPRVLLRLPLETAKQLGLHRLASRRRWQQAAESKKTEPLKGPLSGRVSGYDDPVEPV